MQQNFKLRILLCTFEYLNEYNISRRDNREDRSVVYCLKYIITVTLLKHLIHLHTNTYIINSISSENSLITQTHITQKHIIIYRFSFFLLFIFIQHCIGHSSCYIVTYTSFKVFNVALNEICCCFAWTWAIYGSHFEWPNLHGQLNIYLFFFLLNALCIKLFRATMWISGADLDSLYDQKSHIFSLEIVQKVVFYLFDRQNV